MTVTATDRYRFQHWEIPEHMRKPLENYFCHGIRPGGFLSAILYNDWYDAILRADHLNLVNIAAYAFYLHKHAPPGSWGSREIMERWIETKSAERRADEEENPHASL